jgi:hypothetical protein
MRTPIRLDDALLRRAKAAAAASGQSLNDLIVAAVRAAIEPRRSAPRAMDVPTFKGRGLRPNVDLDNALGLSNNREIGVAAKLRCAVQDARLAAHHQMLHVARPHH